MESSVSPQGFFSSILIGFVVLLNTRIFLYNPVEAALVAKCSFENTSQPYCEGWTVPRWSDGPWSSSRGSISDHTGPQKADQSIGGERFLFLNSTAFRNDKGFVDNSKTVGLLTPELPRVTCIAFMYMKHGDQDIGPLRVGNATNTTEEETVLWTKNGPTTKEWQCKLINASGGSQSIFFEAASSNPLGDTAIDEVHLYDTPCPDENDCFGLLNGSLVTTTLPPTSTPTSSPTSLMSSSPAEFPTSSVETTTRGNEGLSRVDIIIMCSTVIPIGVLIVAGIVAFICYRRRKALRKEEYEREMMRRHRAFSVEEHYDFPEDGTTSHYDLPSMH